MDKREYYAALLANAALPGRPDTNTLESMVDTLESPRKPHLWLLAALLGSYDWSEPPLPYGGGVERDWRVLEQQGLVSPIPRSGMSQEGARQFRAFLSPSAVAYSISS